jgi:hypothetical protein
VGCYGFAGGGLPPGIKTVAIIPFDNLTSEPALQNQVYEAVREAVTNRLGLLEASESQADAIVRGTITRYEPDLPVAFQGSSDPAQRQVTVTRRLVQLTVNVEIINQRTEKPLWQRQGLTTEGDYDPGNEPAGRARALDRLTVNIVEGAQSQW